MLIVQTALHILKSVEQRDHPFGRLLGQFLGRSLVRLHVLFHVKPRLILSLRLNRLTCAYLRICLVTSRTTFTGPPRAGIASVSEVRTSKVLIVVSSVMVEPKTVDCGCRSSASEAVIVVDIHAQASGTVWRAWFAHMRKQPCYVYKLRVEVKYKAFRNHVPPLVLLVLPSPTSSR
jgi:hypothetical protein